MIKIKNSIVDNIYYTCDSLQQNAKTIEITSYLFYFLEKLYHEMCNSKKYYHPIRLILSQEKYKQHISKKKKYLTNISHSLNMLQKTWQNPRISGTINQQIVQENREMVESIKQTTVAKLEPNIASWRLLSLSLVGDRLQPAHLLAPYIKQNSDCLSQLHSYIYNITQNLRSIEIYLNEDKEIIHNFCYRMRGLCISIEENAPQKTQFEFQYNE